MRNLNPEQHDTGTRLATPSRRRPFSECNKGNRRRLHAGYLQVEHGIANEKTNFRAAAEQMDDRQIDDKN